VHFISLELTKSVHFDWHYGLLRDKIDGQKPVMIKNNSSDPASCHDNRPFFYKSFQRPAITANILIVDDNKFNRILIEAILDEYGASHKAAVNGFEALKLVKRETFDLILMDIKLPGMDGYETTKRIRSMDLPVCSIPIIAVTSNNLENDPIWMEKSGLSSVVLKPIEAEILITDICEQLNKSKPST